MTLARLFLAVPLPARLQSRLAEEIRRLEALRAPVAWVAPDMLHLTLRFIGEADEAAMLEIGRAYGVLRNAYVLSSSEAMNMLSLVRLGVDLGMFVAEVRPLVDRLFIECQPGHVQYSAKKPIEPGERDMLRATLLRSEFEKVATPVFSASHHNDSNASS